MGLCALEAKQVIATDLEDILEDNTKKNVKCNEGNLNLSNMVLIPLEWDNKEHVEKVYKLCDHFDMIIVCECLYIEAPFDKFLRTLIALCTHYKDVEVVFAYKKRYIFQENAMKSIAKFFDIIDIPKEEIYHEFRNKSNYYIFKLKLKN